MQGRSSLTALMAMAMMGSVAGNSSTYSLSPRVLDSSQFRYLPNALVAKSRRSGMTAARQKRASIKAKNRKRNKASH